MTLFILTLSWLALIAALCYIVHLLDCLRHQRTRLAVIRARYGKDVDGLRLMPGRLVIETVVRPPRDVRLN
jgi:hypothetical protein